MEPFASTVVREDDGSLTIYDKTQGSQSNQAYICSVFGLSKDKVRIVNALWAVASALGFDRRTSSTLPY